MRRLYLHIGYPKTGTTAIQAALVRNAARLAKAGVLYPFTGRPGDAHYDFNFSLGIGYPAGGRKIEEPQILREKLSEEVEHSGCERIIISSEVFSIAKDVGKVRELFAGYDVQVVVYLRRHDHALESAYSQSFKSVHLPPWQPTIESFVLYQLTRKAREHDYLHILRRWAAQFGKDAISVRPYERSQNAPDLLADFLRTVEVADTEEFIRPKNVNISLSTRSTSAIQAVRRTSIPKAAKDRIIGTITAMETQRPKGHHLSPALRNALVNRFSPAYRVIATEFMGRPGGMLFDDPVPQPSDPWVRPPEISENEVLDLVLRATARCMN